MSASSNRIAEIARIVKQTEPFSVRKNSKADLVTRWIRAHGYAGAKLQGFTKAANRVVFDALGVKPTKKRRKVKKYWKRYTEGR